MRYYGVVQALSLCQLIRAAANNIMGQWVEYLGNEQDPTAALGSTRRRRPNPKRIQKMKNATSDDDIATFAASVGYGMAQ